MINFKKIFVSIAFLVFFGQAFAVIDKDTQPITARHFTIAPPFSIMSVEADTNITNFSVVKTSDYTFDVLWDYISPDTYSYASVKLWVMKGDDVRYARFINYNNTGLGIEFIECGGCPNLNKIDSNNYEFIYK